MTSSGPVRIGDAERDQAATALGEHYASGRITKQEYDERLESVWAARFGTDLRTVFADLPGPHGPLDMTPASPRAAPSRPMTRSMTRPGVGRFPPLRLLGPVAVAALATVAFAVLIGAPWLLFVIFWLFACGGFGHRRGPRHQRWQAGHHPHRHPRTWPGAGPA